MRFLLVGLSNTVIGLALIWLCLRALGLDDVPANAIGYLAGFLWSFMLNRSWTFRYRGTARAGLRRYAMVCLLAYIANLLTVLCVREYFGRGSLPSQIFGIVVYTGLAYTGSRFYAFPAVSKSEST